MSMLSLARKSLWSRRATSALVVWTIAVSVTLLLGVEHLRADARNSFSNTISQTDLVVGARGGPINLLLYSVFHIGDPTNNISWDSYKTIASDRSVAWTVPLSLGDSHRGFRVLGTTEAYFAHYHYGRAQPLKFAAGHAMADLFDAVIGAAVADKLGYRIGESIVVSHGVGAVSFAEHKDKPFRVVGILARTGTPVDQTVHVSLAAIEAIHADWHGGMPSRDHLLSADEVRRINLTPHEITAMLVGLKSKTAIFRLQRMINEFDGEPLLAVLPGLTLQQLWDLLGVAENVLLMVSGLVVGVGLCVMLTALLTGLQERRREMAILRALGARPVQIFALILGEAFLLAGGGLIVGVILLQVMLKAFLPTLASRMGLEMGGLSFSLHELWLLVAVLGCSQLAGLIPAIAAYRFSMADGISARI